MLLTGAAGCAVMVGSWQFIRRFTPPGLTLCRDDTRVIAMTPVWGQPREREA
jgi:hypothetical protein